MKNRGMTRDDAGRIRTILLNRDEQINFEGSTGTTQVFGCSSILVYKEFRAKGIIILMGFFAGDTIVYT